MNIILCTPAFDVRVVGPAVFSHLFYKINGENTANDCRILTTDTAQSADRIYKIEDNYPRRLSAFNFIFRQFYFYKGLRKIQKEFPFDIVIFIDARHAWLSRILFPKSIKMVGFINDYQSVSPFLSMHGTQRRLFFFKYFVRFFERKSAQCMDLIVACSNDLKSKLEDGYTLKSEKVLALFHGFELDNNPFRPHLLPFDSPVKLLFIKSNLRRGAMDILVQSLAKLPQYFFVLTVLGAPNSLKKTIENMLLIAPNVQLRFIGFADTKTVYFEMQNNDILCTPSRDEALGIANAEGLASGISVVSTKVGGIPEVLNNGKNGWLAEPENVEDLADTLKKCIEADPSVRAEKSRCGRLFVEERFDYKKLNAQFLDKCAEILNR